jgi:heat shock protein HslJ
MILDVGVRTRHSAARTLVLHCLPSHAARPRAGPATKELTMLRPFILVGAIVCAALALLGCASNGHDAHHSSGKAINPAERIVGNWQVTAIDGVAIENIPQEGVRDLPTFQVDADGRVAGASGVNRWFSSLNPAELALGTMTLSPIGSTKMAGPPEAMALEQAYHTALNRVRRVDLTALAHDELRLLDAQGNEVLRFVRPS